MALMQQYQVTENVDLHHALRISKENSLSDSNIQPNLEVAELDDR